MKHAALIALCLPLAFAVAAGPALAQTSSAYTTEPSVAIPDGRWDLVSFDGEHGRVIIARGDAVTLVDVKNGQPVRNIGSIARGHDALAIPGTRLIAVTSGQDNTIRLLDAESGNETARIATGADPDAATLDAAGKHLMVMNAKDGTVSVIDLRTKREISRVSVKPALELGVMVASDLLAINNEDANEIELVDLDGDDAQTPIALPGCKGPTGIAYDPASKLLLSACANGQAAIVDMGKRKFKALVPIGDGPDTVLFDAVRKRFLVPCGRSGTLSVLQLGKGGEVTALPAIQTEPSARTGAIDPVSGRVYLPAAKYAAPTPGARPQVVSGSVHLLVLKPTN